LIIPNYYLRMGLFDEIFSSQKLTSPLDFKSLAVDMHSHLIPAVDDGVNSFEEALEIITGLSDMGFSKIIITPHIMSDYYKNTPEIINRGCDSLRHLVDEAKIPIEIEAAAEYLIDDGFEEKLKTGKLMTLGDNYILVELSYYQPHPNLSSIIFNLQIEGYKVILAHPERYEYWHNNFSKYEELKDRGVYFQMNTISLGNTYAPSVLKIAEKLVQQDMVDFLGTDIHNKRTIERLEISRYSKILEILLSSGRILNPTLKY